MCFTNDDDFAEAVLSLCVHGKGQHKYDNVRIGINGRLDTLQAAILMAKFEIFPEETDLRQEVAQRYNKLFSAYTTIKIPYVPEGFRSAWAQYSILAETQELRDEFQTRLKEEGIPTAIYYPRPLHLQTAFAFLGYQEGNFSVSEECSSRILKFAYASLFGGHRTKEDC